MLPLGLFRRPAFTGVQIAAFAVSGSMFALFLYLTLYLQNYLELSPLEAGVRYLPVLSRASSWRRARGAAVPRARPRAAERGAAGSGRRPAAHVGHRSRRRLDDAPGRLPGRGRGVGLLNPVIADVAVSVVPKEQSGMASGINDTFRQVGVVVGIAAWARSSSPAAPGGRGAGGGHAGRDGRRPRQLEAASSGNLDAALAGMPPGARRARRTRRARDSSPG